MIISRGRKFIFVHIPKTGGTAMAACLEGRAMRDDILIGDTPKAQRRKARLAALTPKGRLWKHSTLADIDGVLNADEMSGMFVFTLVRNPWDRMVSYYHWLQSQRFDHPSVRLAQATDFSGFLNDRTTLGAVARHDYHSYVRDPAGTLRCDLFARLEAPDDLAPLWDHLGFRLEMPVVNQSRRKRDWREYYTDQDAQTLGRIAARDIAAFDYRFDPPA